MPITENRGRELGRLHARLVADWRDSGPAAVAAILSLEDRETLEDTVMMLVGMRATGA